MLVLLRQPSETVQNLMLMAVVVSMVMLVFLVQQVLVPLSFDKSDNSLKVVDGAKARFGTEILPSSLNMTELILFLETLEQVISILVVIII